MIESSSEKYLIAMKGESVAELSIYGGICTFCIFFCGLLLSGLAFVWTSSVVVMLLMVTLLVLLAIHLIWKTGRRIKDWEEAKFSFALLRGFPYLAGAVVLPSLMFDNTNWGFLNAMFLVFQFAAAWFVTHFFIFCMIARRVPPLMTWVDGAVCFIALLFGILTFQGF